MAATLRQIVRSLARSPGFTAVVLVTFALGIGATAAISSVVRHVLLRPLPLAQPYRLVQVWTAMPDAGIPQLAVAHAEYLDYRAATRLLAEAGAYTERTAALTGRGEPAQVSAVLTTPSLWTVLGAPPAAGRTIAEGDDAAGAEPVAVLSDGLWRSRFGADPGAVGGTIVLDGVSRRIAGVMPAEFRFPDDGAELWLPITLDPARRDNHHLSVIGRLRDGVELDRLQPEMDAIVAGWARQYTHAHPMFAVALVDQVLGPARRPLGVLFAAVVLVLAIAAANVTGLLLARGEARRRELGVRAALGAGRAALVRLLLAESLLLALAGGALGVVVAKLGLRAILALEPGNLPRAGEIRLDAPVLLFAFGLAVLSGAAAGIVSAWRASRPDVAEILRGSGERTAAGGSRQRLRSALVIAETATAVVLIAGSTLLLRSLANLMRVDPGLEPGHVLTAQLSLPPGRYPKPADVQAFYDALLGRLAAAPGVRSAALVNSLPMRDPIRMVLVGGAWQPAGAEPVGADVVMVSERFGETLGNPVLRGRGFTPADRAGAQRVAALNETAARTLFGDGEAVGRIVTLVQSEPRDAPIEIVAVVRDVPTVGLGTDVRPQVYVPLAQAVTGIRGLTRAVSVVVRTEAAPERFADTLRREVRALDAELPLARVETMERVVAASLRPQRFQSLLLGSFASLALVLAAVGLYGLLAHVAAQRRREFGVRLAVGAAPWQVVALVLRSGLGLTGAGIVIGVAGALAAGRLLRGLVFGVATSDPATLAVAAAVILAAAAVASAVPARRAAAVDPAVTLRDGS